MIFVVNLCSFLIRYPFLYLSLICVLYMLVLLVIALSERLLIMLFVLLTVYTFKLICIFIFVVYCVYAVLMIAYNSETEALRKCVVVPNTSLELGFSVKSRDSVDDKLEVLTEQLTEKERALQQSQNEIKNAEEVLNNLESKTSTCRDRYRSLIIELKTDIRKTKDEVRTLQNQISRLSIRREALKTEVLMQQEDYQQMLNSLSRKLENKKTLFCLEKSRHHRVSCFPLP